MTLLFCSTTSVGAEDLLPDGSFEAGTSSPPNNPFWTESSTNFGSVICRRNDPNLENCDPVSGDPTFKARTGAWFAWFGGFVKGAGLTSPELSSLVQEVTIPADAGSGQASATLLYHVMVRRCSTALGDAADVFEVRIDGALEDSIGINDPDCGSTSYREETVDLTNYLGQTVDLQLEGVFAGNANPPTSFLIDDLALYSCQYAADAVVANETLTGVETRKGCVTLTAGPAAVIATGATVEFEAPVRVVLGAGVRVESGGSLRVRTGV
jgi:hypothetical protein